MLIIMEYRDVQLGAQPLLDFEAAWGGDVLEVDPAVDRGNRLDDLDDLVRVRRVQADRPRVDAGESFEQRRLSLHNWQGCGRSDVAEAQHRRAVGDDRNGVSLDRQPAGIGRVLSDRQAYSSHSWCIGP